MVERQEDECGGVGGWVGGDDGKEEASFQGFLEEEKKVRGAIQIEKEQEEAPATLEEEEAMGGNTLVVVGREHISSSSNVQGMFAESLEVMSEELKILCDTKRELENKLLLILKERSEGREGGQGGKEERDGEVGWAISEGRERWIRGEGGWLGGEGGDVGGERGVALDFMSQSQDMLRNTPSEKKKKSGFSEDDDEDDDGGKRGRGFEGDGEREGEREAEREAEVKAEVERKLERERERERVGKERERERRERERGKPEIDEAIARRKEEVDAYHHKLREEVAAIQGIYSLSSNGNITAEFAGRFSEFVPAVDTEEEDQRVLMQTEYRGIVLRAKHRQHPARTGPLARPIPTTDKRSKASKSADKSADKSASPQKLTFSESRRHRDKEAEREKEKEKDLAHGEKLKSAGFSTATRALPVPLRGVKSNNEVNFKTLRAACGQLGGKGGGGGVHVSDAHTLPKSKKEVQGKGGVASVGRASGSWVEYAERYMVLAKGEVHWYSNEAEYEARVWPKATFPIR
jgi:hypothetical protein